MCFFKEKFYHDKANRGAFVVRCELSANGPCRRMLVSLKDFWLVGWFWV